MFEQGTSYDVINEYIKSQHGFVMQIMKDSLTSQNIEIQISAAQSCISILIALDDEGLIWQYESFIGVILDTIMNAQNTEGVCKIMSKLAELIEVFPEIVQNKLQKLVGVMVGIGKSKAKEWTFRSSAVEVLRILIQTSSHVIQSDAFSIQEILTLAMEASAEISTNIEQWTQKIDSENQIEPYYFGTNLLSYLSEFLQTSLWPYISQIVPIHLNSPDWIRQHTGLLTIGQTAQGLHDCYEQQLSQILNMILPFCTSQNPRLVWASMNALGLLCTEFEPDIQIEFFNQILPALINILRSENCQKVQIQTILCLINFVKGYIGDDIQEYQTTLGNYIPQIMDSLYSLINLGMVSNSSVLIEQCLNAGALIAQVMQTEFLPHYQQFMQYCKQFVFSVQLQSEQRQLKSVAIKAMGYVFEALSELQHANVINEAVLVFQNILEQGMDFSSIEKQGLLEDLNCYAACMGDNLAGFLPMLVPELMQYASAEFQIEYSDITNVNLPDAPGMESIVIQVAGENSKKIAVNTQQLQSKEVACKALMYIIQAMKHQFRPYADQVLSCLINLIDFHFKDQIRMYAIKSISHLIPITQNPQQTMMCSLQKLMETIKKSNSTETKRILRALHLIFTEIEPVCLGLSNASILATQIEGIIRDIYQQKVQRATQKSSDYQKYLDRAEMEEQTDNKILQYAMEVISHLLKSFKNDFRPIFQSNFKNLFAELLFKPSPSDSELYIALCIFNDYLLYTNDLMITDNKLPLLEYMIQFCYSSSVKVRQSAVYGIGLYAERAQREIFDQYAINAIQMISYILNLPEAREDEVQGNCTDCAIGALGRVAIYQRPECISTWLQYLPIQTDEEEAQAMHGLLMKNMSFVAQYGDCAQVVGKIQNMSGMNPKILNDETRVLMENVRFQ